MSTPEVASQMSSAGGSNPTVATGAAQWEAEQARLLKEREEQEEETKIVVRKDAADEYTRFLKAQAERVAEFRRQAEVRQTALLKLLNQTQPNQAAGGQQHGAEYWIAVGDIVARAQAHADDLKASEIDGFKALMKKKAAVSTPPASAVPTAGMLEL